MRWWHWSLMSDEAVVAIIVFLLILFIFGIFGWIGYDRWWYAQ